MQQTAMAGTIQCTERKELQPNQNIPIGIKADSTQVKESLPSGVEGIRPSRLANLSCQIDNRTAIIEPMLIATHVVSNLQSKLVRRPSFEDSAYRGREAIPAKTAPDCSTLNP
jgi:hypothetical protein